MATELVPVPGVSAMDQLVELTLATCASPQTRRVYATHIRQFLLSGYPLNREGVALHLQDMRKSGKGTPSLMLGLAAIRKFATEAQLRGLISFETYSHIHSIKNPKLHKTRTGMWLTLEQVEELLCLPDRSTYYGKRDACILVVMIGCGFRRSEMANLQWKNYQDRDGRRCFVDIVGKGDKRRTVPVPVWAQPDVDAWYTASREAPPEPTTKQEEHYESIRTRNPEAVCGGLGQERLYDLVEAYGNRMGLEITPHDLRRTLAQLLRKAGAPLEQIQYTLGHEKIITTSLYLGSSLELGKGLAAVDKLQIRQRDEEEE